MRMIADGLALNRERGLEDKGFSPELQRHRPMTGWGKVLIVWFGGLTLNFFAGFLMRTFFLIATLVLMAIGKSFADTNSVPSDAEIRRLLAGHVWGSAENNTGTFFKADGRYVSVHGKGVKWDKDHPYFDGTWQVTNGWILYFNERSNSLPLVQNADVQVDSMSATNLVCLDYVQRIKIVHIPRPDLETK